MTNEAVAGFWSYAHEDDRLDNGTIVELARLIAEEYNLLSGEPLELFVDRDSLAWGQEWRARIDAALSQTTFFIPIVTPRYFLRPECRRELLEFTTKAKSLGVEELLLPILYVGVAQFSEENSDEAIVLAAKTQYEDWQDLRLLEPSSREYRKAVNRLAHRLLEIAREVSARQLDGEVSADLEDDGLAGIADLAEEITALLPEWLDAVIGEKLNDAQIQATSDHLHGAVNKLLRSRAPASAVLAARIRLAREMLPLLERKQRDARIYLARSVELDPFISSLARLLSDHPDSFPVVAPIREAIDEAMETIHRLDTGKSRFLGEPFGELSHFGRIFQKCNAIALDFRRAISEANSIVERWDSELQRAPNREVIIQSVESGSRAEFAASAESAAPAESDDDQDSLS